MKKHDVMLLLFTRAQLQLDESRIPKGVLTSLFSSSRFISIGCQREDYHKVLLGLATFRDNVSDEFFENEIKRSAFDGFMANAISTCEYLVANPR